MKTTIKTILFMIACLIVAAVLVFGIAACVLLYRTAYIDNDFSTVTENEKYAESVEVNGVEVITQSVSCGYAVIEMFSAWSGGNVTEESLMSEHGKVITSTAKAFCDEFNAQFPQYKTTMYSYLKNTELLEIVYDSLANGIPVPIEWAALCNSKWTLHFSLVTGMDLPNDTVTVANPYGYTEKITISEFLSRTTYKAYGDMPLNYALGFTFGIFEKNTVFIPTAV